MSEFHEAVNATIAYLNDLKRHGVTHVPVRRETLDALATPLPSPARPAAKPAPAAPAPQAATPISTDMSESKIKYSGATKAEKLASLREQAVACHKCDHLVKSRTQVVFGVGNPETELMFVGEAPGADEDAQGEPFVGRAGQKLTEIIQAMGYKRSEIYIGNVLKCRPNMPAGESGNRPPTGPEMLTCLPWLHAQIDIIKPKALVALGAVAMRGLMPELSTGISKLRGTWLLYRGIPLMPTFHPAYLLRNYTMENRKAVWSDMQKVLEKLGRPVPGKSR